jgi:O-antigen/teichoic acid export membrane protein
MALIAFNAELIIHFIFGVKWSEAIPILEVLCFAGAIQSISQVGGVIFSSTGKPELGIYFAFIRTSLTTISVIVGSYFGIMTVAYLLLISKGLSFGLLLILIRRYIHFDWIDFFNHIKVQFATVGSLAIVYISFMNLDHTLSWLKFLVMLILIFGITLSYHFKLIKEIFINIKAKV